MSGRSCQECLNIDERMGEVMRHACVVSLRSWATIPGHGRRLPTVEMQSNVLDVGGARIAEKPQDRR